MEQSTGRGTGFDGRHHIMLSERTLTAMMKQQPLLRGLLAAGAGYFPKAAGHVCRRPQGLDQAILIYCVRGGGWCEMAGHLHTVREGDVLVVPPDVPHTYGAHASNPWTIHWIHAAGANVHGFLEELAASPQAPLIRVGENLQVVLLFNEVVKTLERGVMFSGLLHASHALGHLLALLICHRHEHAPETSTAIQKAAQCIVYMSEHLDQPLRVASLAALANLSTAHFTALFKEQTGCSPRDYLHLLRIHRACQWLRDPALSVKDIASRLGYQDQFHFSRQFKAFQGVSPSQYRTGPVG